MEIRDFLWLQENTGFQDSFFSQKERLVYFFWRMDPTAENNKGVRNLKASYEFLPRWKRSRLK